jgi:hypothetical protein
MDQLPDPHMDILTFWTFNKYHHLLLLSQHGGGVHTRRYTTIHSMMVLLVQHSSSCIYGYSRQVRCHSTKWAKWGVGDNIVQPHLLFLAHWMEAHYCFFQGAHV